ncbi:hypothetical protein I4U23_004292 [Adineta vaga]|nr:hypothetical protein I4U23_004292 [Adineta vaga]
MSSNGTAFTNQLSLLSLNTNRYGSLVIFLLGSVGVTLNIVIFGTDQELKKTPCSRIFLASSIAASIVLISGLPTRFLSSFGLDITARYDAICKLFIVTLFSSYSCSALFTSFLSVERWLNSCTNVNYRNWSSMKNVYRVIIITPVVIFLCYSQIFYCYIANQKSERSGCSPMSGVCSYFNDFLHLTLFVLIPCAIMLIFGSLTVYNIKRNLNRIEQGQPTGSTKSQRRMVRTQSAITLLMFTQVFLLTFCNSPAGIQKIYSTITANVSKSSERRAIESVIFQYVFIFNFVGVALPFYLYTLAGAVFREALLRRIRIVFYCLSTRPQMFSTITRLDANNSITLQKIPAAPLNTVQKKNNMTLFHIMFLLYLILF